MRIYKSFFRFEKCRKACKYRLYRLMRTYKEIVKNYILISKNALMTHPELCEQVVHYDTFTDIEFNPNKSINCQARSVAIFVTLNRLNQLDKVSSQSLFSTLYSKQSVNNQEPLPFS